MGTVVAFGLGHYGRGDVEGVDEEVVPDFS